MMVIGCVGTDSVITIWTGTGEGSGKLWWMTSATRPIKLRKALALSKLPWGLWAAACKRSRLRKIWKPSTIILSSLLAGGSINGVSSAIPSVVVWYGVV